MNWIDRPIEKRHGGPRLKYHSAAERQAARKRSRLLAYAKEKVELAEAAQGRRAAGMGTQPESRPVPPPDILADAERIKHMRHPTLVGHLMGDPLPGRSALDKQR